MWGKGDPPPLWVWVWVGVWGFVNVFLYNQLFRSGNKYIGPARISLLGFPVRELLRAVRFMHKNVAYCVICAIQT